MQRLQFALFQIDEAKRHLEQDALPALRVALLLLDNAAEVLLDRWIARDIQSDDFWGRVRDSARNSGISDSDAECKEIFAQRSLSGQERKRVAHFFDEKLCYVAETKKGIPRAEASVLSHLHRSRNEACHSGRVKQATLRSSIVILLELCCRLVTSLRPSAGYGSNEDFSWLKKRFGIGPFDLADDEELEKVVAEFRQGVSIDGGSLCVTLAENLENRIEQQFGVLDFISGAATTKMGREKALSEAQAFTLGEIERCPPYRPLPKRLEEKVSLAQLEEMQAIPDQVKNEKDLVKAFEIYANCNTALERIEYMTGQLAAAIEDMIQNEIDIARGK